MDVLFAVSAAYSSGDNLRLQGKPIEADKTYKVADWAQVAEAAKSGGNKMI